MAINVKYLKDENLIYVKEDSSKTSTREILNKTREVMEMAESYEKSNVMFDCGSTSMDKNSRIKDFVKDLDEYSSKKSIKFATICDCDENKKSYNYKFFKERRLSNSKAFTKNEKENVEKFLEIKINNLI